MPCKAIVYLLVALLALGGAARADKLCAAQCEIDIEFPGGGSIIARQRLTFTFGANGLVDTAGSVTAYLDGETLTLNTGDRLQFGSGGRFALGDGGNLDFTDAILTTGGVARIKAVGGAERLEIPTGRVLSVFGGADLIFKAVEVALQGKLQLSANGQLGLYNDAATGCGINAFAPDAVSIGLVSIVVTPDNSACGRLLGLATVEVIDEFAYTSEAAPADDDDESGDASTISAPTILAMLALMLLGAARRDSHPDRRRADTPPAPGFE